MDIDLCLHDIEKGKHTIKNVIISILGLSYIIIEMHEETHNLVKIGLELYSYQKTIKYLLMKNKILL